MGNCDKTKHTCVDKNYATCIQYELDIPEYSELSNEPCVNLEETTEDLYNIIGEMKDDTDLSELGESCLQYITGEERNTIKKVLLKYEEEICTLKEKVELLETEAICEKNITECGIDLSSLIDQCDNQITTLGGLLQYLVNNQTP